MSGYDENVVAISNRCDCEERQTMSHLMTCDDAPNCTWTDLAILTLADVNDRVPTLGGIYITAAIEDSTKKTIVYIFAVLSLDY